MGWFHHQLDDQSGFQFAHIFDVFRLPELVKPLNIWGWPRRRDVNIATNFRQWKYNDEGMGLCVGGIPH